MASLARAVRWTIRLILLSAALVLLGFVVFVHSIAPERVPDGRIADGIVALTGGNARIGEAVRLLTERRATRMLITGVHPSTTREQLRLLVRGDQRLFECCIDLGRQAEDTSGNAVETRRWTELHGFKSIIVVTSSYHMPRALVELRRVVPGVDVVPHTVEPRSFRNADWWRDQLVLRLIVTEYVKYLPALVRLYVSRITGDDGEDSP